jgi:phosphatidylserine decarboxylase
VQIAGLIARRILCDLEEDIEVKIGERLKIS